MRAPGKLRLNLNTGITSLSFRNSFAGTIDYCRSGDPAAIESARGPALSEVEGADLLHKTDSCRFRACARMTNLAQEVTDHTVVYSSFTGWVRIPPLTTNYKTDKMDYQ